MMVNKYHNHNKVARYEVDCKWYTFQASSVRFLQVTFSVFQILDYFNEHHLNYHFKNLTYRVCLAYGLNVFWNPFKCIVQMERETAQDARK
jgi:hypothetical protein